MDLDITVNKQLHQGQGGLSSEAKQLHEDDLIIPEYFMINDARKPAEIYVKEKLRGIID